MNESQFNSRVDELLFEIEEALDASGVDVDYENVGGVLTITCENNASQVIISRQPALSEVWVAAKSGGFHLADVEGDFICSVTGEPLRTLLNRVLTEQCEEPVALQW